MICKRCGTGGVNPEREYCLHCRIAVDLEKAIGKSIGEMGIDEGFPDWMKPTRKEVTNEQLD